MTETVVREGVLEMDPVDQGKGFQGTWLLLDGGERLLLSYRPMEAYFRFVERRVVVRGRHFLPSAEVQHIMADHFAVESVALAPGERADEPAPAVLPAPPLVEDGDALGRRIGRWALVVGTLRLLAEGSSSAAAPAAVIELGDRTSVPVHSLSDQAAEEARGLAGRRVTALSRVGVLPGQDGPRMEHAFAVCPGSAHRCGMD